MRMEEVRAQFDDESGPHGLRLTGNFDREVFGLDQERVAATPIPLGFDLGAQPLWAVRPAAVLGVFRRLFCLTELGIDLGAHSSLRGDGERIQPSQERYRLSCLRLGQRFGFGWTPSFLWLYA